MKRKKTEPDTDFIAQVMIVILTYAKKHKLDGNKVLFEIAIDILQMCNCTRFKDWSKGKK